MIQFPRRRPTSARAPRFGASHGHHTTLLVYEISSSELEENARLFVMTRMTRKCWHA